MLRIVLVLIFLSFTLIGKAQNKEVTLSGVVKQKYSDVILPYVNIIIKTERDTVFVSGTITDENGRFTFSNISPGNYVLESSNVGYHTNKTALVIGKLSEYLDLGTIEMTQEVTTLGEVVIAGKQDAVAERLDKKTFTVSDNVSQSGGSLLQVMKNLPGISVSNDGRIQLRGSDKVVILIDGKQTALTGFGGQEGLDNIPGSAIEKIEVINNPSSKYDANGNAGIINIVYKKDQEEGLNGKVGLMAGLGALWVKEENLPTIRPQFQRTPKVNPSLSLNYRMRKINLFVQADNLYTKILNKNEFVDRFYESGETIRQQTKRNRTTNVVTAKAGFDWFVNDKNSITASGLFSSEDIIDRGDEPFFNPDLSERLRLWQFLEDEVKTTVTESASWQHKFEQPGRVLNVGFNYTFHRENEKYFFTNILPTYTGLDSFKLISDEHVGDANVDYVHPLRHGRFESGIKFRNRYIPTNMLFIPGLNSPLDVSAGGWANYSETIPAVYSNYIFENNYVEVEAGLRLEYVKIFYEVNPDHKTYKSDGYDYFQPFPNVRFTYKANASNTLSFFYNRRVDRPNEVDIRIFPKYDDAEIIKVGNPALRPQFTDSFEVAHKKSWNESYLYTSLYHKRMDATITRIGSIEPGSTIIYNIFQNAGKSYTAGTEIIFSKNFRESATLSLNFNGYKNIIDAFTVINKYPTESTYSANLEQIFSGNIKANAVFHFADSYDFQIASVYQAPDIIPQGKIYSRFYIDVGLKKSIQRGKGELYANATDVANTLRIKRRIEGNGFRYVSTDFYETQVFRIGYTYKF